MARSVYLGNGLYRTLVGRPTDVPSTVPDPGTPTTALVHPGVLYSAAQLEHVRGRIAASASPWTGYYTSVTGTRADSGANSGQAYTSPTWTPNPTPEVGRTASNGAQQGASDLIHDLTAAVVNALAWAYKADRVAALRATRILNAWSSTITRILYSTTWADGKLLAGWTGTLAARAAEIIRHTFTPAVGEEQLDVPRLAGKFRTVWWPLFDGTQEQAAGVANGAGHNIVTSIADSAMQIAVFLDDRTRFDWALKFWRDNLPAVAWMNTDNNPYAWGDPQTINYSSGGTLVASNGLPLPPPGSIYDKPGLNAHNFMLNYWRGPRSLPNGLWGETGRDILHTAMGMAGLFNAAETARHQGVDLWAEEQDRLVAACELIAGYINGAYLDSTIPPPAWPFGDWSTADSSNNFQRTTYVIAWEELVGRLGASMPKFTRMVNDYVLTSTYKTELHVVGEHLTHRGTGSLT